MVCKVHLISSENVGQFERFLACVSRQPFPETMLARWRGREVNFGFALLVSSISTVKTECITTASKGDLVNVWSKPNCTM